jgi:GNAT superfamily N-acetyltransferase
MIKLVATGGNPFETYPQLRAIWPKPYATFAERASTRDSETGQVLLITFEGTVVGISGVFDERDDKDDIYLRWTGVVPGLRGRGIGKRAIELLVDEVCPRFYATRSSLIELVPENEYGRTLVEPFFRAVGFAKHGGLVTYDWINHAWQPYILHFKTGLDR